MRGTYIAVAVMTAIVLAAIGYGFFSAGSPWAVRGYKLDATRISDFSSIQSAIQEYDSSNYKLPATLADVASSTYGSYYASQNVFKDPETQQPFDYKVTSHTEYQLCATFAASSDEESQYNGGGYYYGGSNNNQHKKGYDCISYSLPAMYPNELQAPMPGTYPYPQQYPQSGVYPTVPTASSTATTTTPLKNGGSAYPQ